MQLLPNGADYQIWQRLRRTGVGGSDALAVCGLSEHTSRYEVWLDKTGRLPAYPETLAMRLGRLLEPTVALLFEEETGLRTRVTGTWRSHRHPHMLANPDRLTDDGNLVEIKTTNSFGGKHYTVDQIPDHAEAQLQHYLAVTGAPGAYVAALIGNERLDIRYVARDDALIADLVAVEADFWRLVESDSPPPVDGHPATTRALTAVHADVNAWRVELPPGAADVLVARHAAQQRLDAAQGDLDAANNQLRQWLGDAAYGTIGDVAVVSNKLVTTRRIPAAAIRAEHPDIAQAVTVERTHRRLVSLANHTLAQADPAA